MKRYYICPKCKRNLTEIDFTRKSQYTHSKYINKHICVYCGTRTIIEESDEYNNEYTKLIARAKACNVDIVGFFRGSVEKNNGVVEVHPPYVRFYDNDAKSIHRIFKSLQHSSLAKNYMSADLIDLEDGTTEISVGTEAWVFHTKEGREQHEDNLTTFRRITHGLFANAAKRNTSDQYQTYV